MTSKQFYDWQTSGGTDDVIRLVNCLGRADIRWGAIGGVAVNRRAEEPMVTQGVDFVVTAEDVERTVEVLRGAGFGAQRDEGSVNFTGHSKVRIQLSAEEDYLSYPERSIAADVHGILLRVANLEDTLAGNILEWSDSPLRVAPNALADFTRSSASGSRETVGIAERPNKRKEGNG